MGRFSISASLFLVISLLVLGSLSGCGACSRMKAHYSGFDRVCVEGVSYLQFPSGVSVEYAQDGKIRYCR